MIVMDGWGIGKDDETNPIFIEKPKNIEYIKHHFLSGALQASSISVGLPWNEEGNSEVGHLTLGSGRVIYQHYPRISIAIKNDSFFKNEVLLNTINKAKEKGTAVNFVGLLGEGTVHSAMEHLVALLRLAKQENLPYVNLHLFTDGKDGPTKKALEHIDILNKEMERYGYGSEDSPEVRWGSICGRYYGMDRDQHWERTELAYNSILGLKQRDGEITPKEAIQDSYDKGLTDEFIEPRTTNPDAIIKDGDSVIFFNFREDSIRQIVEMFLDPTAIDKNLQPLKDLYMCSFTEYSTKFNIPVAFPSEDVVNPLGKVLSDNGKVQLRIAETNKYAHITYFFNGYIEQPFKNEYRILVPSQNVAKYDEHPEMMAKGIGDRAVQAISEGVYDFILINFANSDIVAHTGNFEATQKAVATVDEQIGRLMAEVLKKDGVMLVTADHGNAEQVRDPLTGVAETKHNASPVPVYIIGKEFERNKSNLEARETERISAGILSDISPTILEIMGIPQPDEMTGVSLLRILK